MTPWSIALSQKLTDPQTVKKFPAFYGTPKVHYRNHKSPPPVPVLSQINPVHASASHYLKIYFNINLPSTPMSFKWVISFTPLTKTLHESLLPPIHNTCPTHPIASQKTYLRYK